MNPNTGTALTLPEAGAYRITVVADIYGVGADSTAWIRFLGPSAPASELFAAPYGYKNTATQSTLVTANAGDALDITLVAGAGAPVTFDYIRVLVEYFGD